MQLTDEVCENARLVRDPRFDGRFFVGVLTTGIYCRPVCRVRMPHRRNVRFFVTAAAAMEAGLRPCLRCRPETAPGSPAWNGTSATVNRGLALIEEGALDGARAAALAERLGVTDRHLRRLFVRHVGATPQTVADCRRVLLAKQMIDETSMQMSDIAMSAGFGSLRSFNDRLRRVYGRTPSQLRGEASGASGVVLRLRYRPPYDWPGILQFFARRATPGVEAVVDNTYVRSIRIGPQSGNAQSGNAQSRNAQSGKAQSGNARSGVLRISHDPAGALVANISVPQGTPLLPLVGKVRRMFDLHADPEGIVEVLTRDRDLRDLVRENPGCRLPGAWDPFEAAIRAIVGQQVSVVGATTVMGKVVEIYGDRCDGGDGAVPMLFPRPEVLAELRDEDMPMPRVRAGAVRTLAAHIASGEITLDSATDVVALQRQLLEIKGIGPWTAQYVAMRALSDPDAFLASDLVLMRVARERFGDAGAVELEARSERWRPWRAYAGLHLWRSVG